jgi:CIC family chloride channel protein
MIATVLASLIVHHGFGFFFFTRQLDQRGLDVMRRDYVAAERTEKLFSLRERLKSAPHSQLCVVDGAGVLHGIITLQDLGEAAFDTSRDNKLTARAIARRLPPVLKVTDTLDAALRLMEAEREKP